MECSCQYSNNYDFFGVIEEIYNGSENTLIYSNNNPNWYFGTYVGAGYKLNINAELIEGQTYTFRIKDDAYGDEQYECRDLMFIGDNVGIYQLNYVNGYLETTIKMEQTLSNEFEIIVITDTSTADFGDIEIYCAAICNTPNSVKFNKLPVANYDETKTNILWVPSNPELGDGKTIIGDGAYSAGYSNRANQVASAAFGKNNNAAGKYSFVANRDNVAGYSAAAFGMKTKAKGEYSFTAGYNTYAKKNAVALNKDTQAIHENAMAINQGTISTLWSQLVCGTYNSLDATNAMFIVGNGDDDSNRSNAFIVNRDASAVLGGSLTSNGIISNNNMQVTGSISCTGDISFNGSTLKNNGTTIIKAGINPPTIILGVNNSNRPSDSLTWGNGAISAGSSKAYHENAIALGDNSTAYSFNSIAIGYGNNAGLASDLAIENKWHGSSVGAVAIGWGNNVINSYSVAVGTHLLTKHSTQTVIGCYNTEDENAAVIFGAGVNDAVRYNALTIKSNFNKNNLSSWVEVAEQGTTDNSVATKKYIDDLHLVKSEGDNSTQQILDTDSYSWTVNNPSVQELLIDTNIVTLNENGRISNIGALGNFSSVFGGKGLALGKRSFARGTSSIAYGKNGIAEGDQALAYGETSHATGCRTAAIGPSSSASGTGSIGKGEGSDAGGYETEAIGDFSFTRGHKTIANSFASAAFGSETVTSKDVSCQFVAGKHNDNKSNTLFEIGNGNDQQNKSNAFEIYLDGHAEVQTQGETDNSIVTKKYIDGTEQTFNANVIYDNVTSTTPQITTYTYIQKGNTIEARGSVNIDISNAEDLGNKFKIQLPKEAKYTGITLGNILLQLGNGTGYWYQFTGIPAIYDKNYVTIIPNGLNDSYSNIEFYGYKIEQLLESINVENASTIAETITQIQVDFAISYDMA